MINFFIGSELKYIQVVIKAIVAPIGQLNKNDIYVPKMDMIQDKAIAR